MTQTNPEDKTKFAPACCCACSKGCMLRDKEGRLRKGALAGLFLLLCLIGLGWFYYSVKKAPPDSVREELVSTLEKKKMYVYKGDSRDVIHFEVEVAKNPKEQALGLMFRDNIPQGTGMLFVFMPPQEVSFWMKGTEVPLDMLFIRLDGTIGKIKSNAKPHDLVPISSGEPVVGVLEIGGGEAERLGIKVGDRLQ